MQLCRPTRMSQWTPDQQSIPQCCVLLSPSTTGQGYGQERVVLVYQGQTDCLLKLKDWLCGLGEGGWCDALWQELHCRDSILLWKEGEVWQQNHYSAYWELGRWKISQWLWIMPSAAPLNYRLVSCDMAQKLPWAIYHALHTLTRGRHIRKSTCCTYTGWPSNKISVALNIALETEKKLDRLYQVINNWPNFSKFSPTFSWAIAGNKRNIPHLLTPHTSDVLLMFYIHWMLLYLSM